MDRPTLASMIAEGLSTRQIAARSATSQTNIRYWLRKHELRTSPSKPHRCVDCGGSDPDKFYAGIKHVCSRCWNRRTVQRTQDTMSRIREHMGGRCQLCDYDRYPVALELHHLDRRTKDPEFRLMRFWSWQRVLDEAEKCILLCSNCHAAVHAGLAEIPQKGVQ